MVGTLEVYASAGGFRLLRVVCGTLGLACLLMAILYDAEFADLRNSLYTLGIGRRPLWKQAKMRRRDFSVLCLRSPRVPWTGYTVGDFWLFKLLPSFFAQPLVRLECEPRS